MVIENGLAMHISLAKRMSWVCLRWHGRINVWFLSSRWSSDSLWNFVRQTCWKHQTISFTNERNPNWIFYARKDSNKYGSRNSNKESSRSYEIGTKITCIEKIPSQLVQRSYPILQRQPICWQSPTPARFKRISELRS